MCSDGPDGTCRWLLALSDQTCPPIIKCPGEFTKPDWQFYGSMTQPVFFCSSYHTGNRETRDDQHFVLVAPFALRVCVVVTWWQSRVLVTLPIHQRAQQIMTHLNQADLKNENSNSGVMSAHFS